MQPWKEIKREQRAQDRSRRATNPDNYNDDGTVKAAPANGIAQTVTRSGKPASPKAEENSPRPGRNSMAN